MSEVSTDDRGRIYLPKEVRERYGERYRLVQLRNGIKLVPLSDDPVGALREALAPLKGLSSEEVRRIAEEEGLREALDDLR